MFAYALWDEGLSGYFWQGIELEIKPLYYAVVDGRLVFPPN